MLSRIIFALLAAITTLTVRVHSQNYYVETGPIPSSDISNYGMVDVTLDGLTCPAGTVNQCEADIYVATYGALTNIINGYADYIFSYPSQISAYSFDDNDNICITFYMRVDDQDAARDFFYNIINAGTQTATGYLASYIAPAFFNDGEYGLQVLCGLPYTDGGWVGSGVFTVGWNGVCSGFNDEAGTLLSICNA